MKTKTILKIVAVIALLFIGNRFYNHVTAWGWNWHHGVGSASGGLLHIQTNQQ